MEKSTNITLTKRSISLYHQVRINSDGIKQHHAPPEHNGLRKTQPHIQPQNAKPGLILKHRTNQNQGTLCIIIVQKYQGHEIQRLKNVQMKKN